MLSFFRTPQPATILALIVLFVVCKIPFLLHGNFYPVAAMHTWWGDAGLLLTNNWGINFFIAQLCLLTQAFWFNYLFQRADYHEGNSMIPAVYFIFLSSLFPVFNQLSIYTIAGFILLAVFHLLLRITVRDSVKQECFNIGIAGGILLLLDIHFIFFTIGLFFMLYALKPFRFHEYLLLLFGLLFPLYMAAGISYLLDISITTKAFSISHFGIVQFSRNTPDAAAGILLAAYLLFAFISLRGILYSTGFKRRKNLNMLIFFFISITVTIVTEEEGNTVLLQHLFIPLSVFLALLMLRIRKKKIGEILNVIFVTAILTINIIRLIF